MRILVLNPPAVDGVDYIREGRCMQPRSSWTSLLPPLTLMITSAILRQDGHEVRLVDAVAQSFSTERVLADAGAFAPHLLVLNTAFPSIEGDARFAREMATRLPGLRIVAVGLLPTVLPAEAMTRYPWLDYAVVGEPERPVQMLAARLARGEAAAGTPGVAWRNEDGAPCLPEGPCFEPDLDSLPFPDRDSVPSSLYRFPLTDEPLTMVTFSRGCPHPCIFCTAPLFYGRHHRLRSADSLCREIAECRQRYDLRTFIFWGEMVGQSPDLLRNLCERLRQERLDIRWMGAARVDQLSEEMVQAMKNSGCYMVTLGMESASPEILRRSRKGIAPEQAARAASLLHGAGIKVMGHFVVGLPGETEATARETLAFAKRHCDYAQFYCAVPYPGTELAAEAAREGWVVPADWTRYDLTTSLLELPDLGARRVEALRSQAFRSFYLRPLVLWRHARQMRLSALLGRLDFRQWMRSQPSPARDPD